MLEQQDRTTLLEIARASIINGLEEGRALRVRPDEYPEPLRAIRASFVTLRQAGDLRGCIGHLEAFQPLIKDVADNAWAAAFRDPRFVPLRHEEFDRLDIHISLLTPPEPMRFESEADLLGQIRPGRDGLILQDGIARGTFLPSVWESLPDVQSFWMHLKRKAGLPGRHWSNTLKVFRYEAESFPE